MLDVKGDKSLWERMSDPDLGKILLVEESYYDGIVEELEAKRATDHAIDHVLNDLKKKFKEVNKRVEQLEKALKDIRDYEAYNWSNDREYIKNRINETIKY